MDELLNLDLGLLDDQDFIEFTGAESATGTYDEVPDGIYTVEIEKVEAKVSKKDKPFINIWTKIVSEDRKGAMIFMPFFFSSPEANKISAKKIKEVAYALEMELSPNHFRNLNILSTVMDENFKGGRITIEQKTKNDFKNFTIIK